jgi:hypothetical protein
MAQARYMLLGLDLTNFSHAVDGHPQRPTQDQPSQVDSNFSDSSGPVFSLYSKIAVEEDDKTAERWKTNADGILIFVSLRASVHISLHLGSIFIEWFVLCRRCNVARCDDPRPQVKSARYLCVSSRKNPSDPCRSQRIPHRHTFYFNKTIHLLSSKLLCLGQLTLVLELDPQPYMRSSGYIATAVGTPIHQDHSAAATKPPRARAYPRVLLRWPR